MAAYESARDPFLRRDRFGAAFNLDKTIPLPGVEGRFDHIAIDVAAKHLIAAALGNNTVEVLDVAAGKKLQTWSAMKEP